MEQLIWLVPLGFLVGTIGTLIGVGGGFIMMPVLLAVFPDGRPEVLTAISLAVICGNSTSGSIAYAFMKRIHYRAALIYAGAAAPGAALGAVIIDYIPRKPFDIFFGSVLLAVGLYLLLWRRIASDESHAPVQMNPYTVRVGAVLSFFVGILSSLLGIGGGIIHVPAMVYLLAFPVHIATATSHMVLAIMSFVGTMVHVANGTLEGQGVMVAGLLAGVIAGAQAGARISNRVKGKWIMRGLAVALILAAIRIILTA